MKLLNYYGHTFNEGISFSYPLWDLIKDEPSLNGVYIALPDYLNTSHIGITSTLVSTVETWYNMLGDGNYLKASAIKPTLISNDSQFNNYPSIDFNDSGNSALYFNKPINVGTIILVYLTRVTNSYIIYAPRSFSNPNTFYDAFPRSDNQLWSNEPLLDGSIYNAQSRINGKDVLSNVYTPLNSPRILTVKNIANSNLTELVAGFGGQSGDISGSDTLYAQPFNSVKGKIAAILTFESNISLEKVKAIELALSNIYINYTGPVLIDTPYFKYLVGSLINYDFSDIVLDEWFDIVSYELITPTDIGLSFDGSLLEGSVAIPYKGDLIIQVTNSNSISKQFTFSIDICKKDPIVDSLPSSSNLTLIVSADKDDLDDSTYGVVIKDVNNVDRWEDARRIDVPILTTVNELYATYNLSNSLFNSRPSVSFTDTTYITTTPILGKTFVWVYGQSNYGSRKLLDTFSDIKGEGQLWTVSNTNDIHGQTPITKLITKVNQVSVNTLNYKLLLNTLYIITAYQPDNEAIIFNGFTSLRGDLAFFASWNTILTNTQLNAVVSLLANRYFASLAPYIFDESTVYKVTPLIEIDLSKKVSDLQSLDLTYDLLTPHYDSSIDGNVLSVTTITDEVLHYEIDVTNTIPLTSRLEFDLDVTLKTNSLYLNLKSLLLKFTNFFIVEDDSIILTDDNIHTWYDYRSTITSLSGFNVLYATLDKLDGKPTSEFNVDGSSYYSIAGAGTITGKCFILVYVRKTNASGKSFLLGQTSSTEFASGTNGIFLDSSLTSSHILTQSNYINGRLANPNYIIKPSVVNTIILNSDTPLTFNSIAKDRVFTDRSVKGYIPMLAVLDRNITSDEAIQVNKLIRDYYDPSNFVTLIHFNSVIQDSSIRNKLLITNASVSNSIKKFGSSSMILFNNSAAKYIELPNDNDFAFLYEDFAISFWIFLTAQSTDQVVILCTVANLFIYLYNNKLYVGNNTITSLSYFNVTLPGNFYNTSNIFHHIEIDRTYNSLKLYINGVFQAEYLDQIEYTDYTTYARIGQRTNLTTPNIYGYLDEFAIKRRQVLHSSNFTPPSSEYTS